MITSHSPADDGRKNSSESSCYAYIYYYFYVFTQLHKSLNYSYICKNDIPNNKHKMKNNILHTKGIMNCYSQQFVDHNLFKETLLNNNKPQKISFNTISVKFQIVSTNKITKNNIEFLNDKRYIKDINSNIPHTLYVD